MEASNERYIDLLERRDVDNAKHTTFLEKFILLKDYNSQLRMAILNIPSEKGKSKQNQAVKKAKKLANRTDDDESNKKKRKSSTVSGLTEDGLPKPKRAYKRRCLSKTTDTIKKESEPHSITNEKVLDPSDHDDSSTTSSESEPSSSSSSSSEEEKKKPEQEVPKKKKTRMAISDTFI